MDQTPAQSAPRTRRRAMRRESPRQRSILARLRDVRQRISRLRARPVEAPEREFAFLVGRTIDAATLARAERIAAEWAVQ